MLSLLAQEAGGRAWVASLAEERTVTHSRSETYAPGLMGNGITGPCNTDKGHMTGCMGSETNRLVDWLIQSFCLRVYVTPAAVLTVINRLKLDSAVSTM